MTPIDNVTKPVYTVFVTKKIAVFNSEKRVVQKNALLELPYSLKDQSQRLIRLIISQIDDQRDEEIAWYTFKTSDIVEALGIGDSKDYLDQIGRALEELAAKVLFIPAKYFNNEYDVVTHWVNKAKIHRGKNKVDILIDGELAPFLLDIRDRFTKYQLGEILNLRGEYSIRFYEWFLSERFKACSASGAWYATITPHEIRRRLDMLNEKGEAIKFTRWPDLKRRIIDPVVEELSEKTEYFVSWEAITKGKVKVVDLKFHITPKNTTQKKDVTKNPRRLAPDTSEIREEKETMKALKKAFESASEVKKNAVRALHGEKLKALQKKGGKATKPELLERIAEEEALKEAKDSGLL